MVDRRSWDLTKNIAKAFMTQNHMISNMQNELKSLREETTKKVDKEHFKTVASELISTIHDVRRQILKRKRK